MIAPADPGALPDDCGPWIPGQGPWCPPVGPFAGYANHPAKAIALLESAGFDCSRVTGGVPCSRQGRPLTITISAVAGHTLDAKIAASIQHRARAVGIDVRYLGYPASELFSNVAPRGDFDVVLAPFGPVVDPNVTALFECGRIPTPPNGFGGGNWVRLCSKQTDELMQEGDQELDVAKRTVDIQALGRLLADEMPMLPLDVPSVTGAWRSDRLRGVDPASVSSSYGFFFGMTAWYAA